MYIWVLVIKSHKQKIAVEFMKMNIIQQTKLWKDNREI